MSEPKPPSESYPVARVPQNGRAPGRPLKLGRVELPAGPALDGARRAGQASARATRSSVSAASSLARKLSASLPKRSTPPKPGRRPDGSLVSPSLPVSVRKQGRGPNPVAAPFVRAKSALQERWNDAVREGRLAARDKEVEIRADFESRVRHNPAWHAEQHAARERRKDS